MGTSALRRKGAIYSPYSLSFFRRPIKNRVIKGPSVFLLNSNNNCKIFFLNKLLLAALNRSGNIASIGWYHQGVFHFLHLEARRGSNVGDKRSYYDENMFTDNAFEDAFDDVSDEFEDPGCNYSCMGGCNGDSHCIEECGCKNWMVFTDRWVKDFLGSSVKMW